MNRSTIAVTGVASGIGASLASILKDVGHTVIGFDIVKPASAIDQFIPLDLSDPASIALAAQACPDGLTGLGNIAGVPPRDGMEVAILQINFLGQRTFTNALLPKLRTGASIVNMASRAGHRWRDSINQVKRFSAIANADALKRFVEEEVIDSVRAYDLSKEAMILWTAAESEPLIARDIRINSLSPGAVATGILDDFARAFGDRMAKSVARAGRPGTADEIAEIAAFLLSSKSRWIKGTDISIDGGIGAFAMTDVLRLEGLRGSVE
ncbi:MAG: coniferyl-alcohol dehydrogenase [Rhizobiaceae bacterium]